MGSILYRIGRFLQLIGMILLPLAIAGNLTPNDPLDLKTSLMISGAGVCVFLLGYILTLAGGGPK